MLEWLCIAPLLCGGSEVREFDVFEFGCHGPSWTTVFRFDEALDCTGSFGDAAGLPEAFVGGGTSLLELGHLAPYGRTIGVGLDERLRISLRMFQGSFYQLGVAQHVGWWTRELGLVDLHAKFLGDAARAGFGGVPPDKSEVFDCNARGELTGWLSLGTLVFDPLAGRYVAFRANPDARSVELLAVPRSLPSTFEDTWAKAINSSGDVAGQAFERIVIPPFITFQPTAVAWIDGAPVLVGSPDPARPISDLVDIDDGGRAVGNARVDPTDPTTTLAFAWNAHSGEFEWLPPVDGYEGSTVTACAQGFAIGRSYRTDPGQGTLQSTQTLWHAGTAVAITDRIPLLGPWTVSELREVDDHGRILAMANLYPVDPLPRSVLLVPRSGLEVDAPIPQMTGVRNTVLVHGATPGARVQLLVGFAAEVRPLEGCADPLAIVGVAERVLDVPDAVADPAGVARFDLFAPPAFGSVTCVYFQAIEPDDCRTGNLLRVAFP